MTTESRRKSGRLMSVIDPQTWADAEDGRALRELREACTRTGHLYRVEWWSDDDSVVALIDPLDDTFTDYAAPTIAAAADAARAALVKR